ncbi:MAG: hypothetical protein JJ897_01500 [Marinibacterium sp.]|nr:hypothetical protein [Marinibacterium sp.]
MKLFVGVLGLGLIILFGLHGLAPLFGFEDGLVKNWMVWLLVAVSLPLGARMVILRHKRKRELREKGARR